MMRRFLAAALAMLPVAPAGAASLTAIASWTGSSTPASSQNYVWGRPIVMGGAVYGVLGNTLPPNGANYNGSVYELTPPATGSAYAQSIIASFTGGAGGGNPVGGLTADSAGNLYGAAYSGGSGASSCTATQKAGCGLIFKLTGSGTSWTKTTIYTFTGGSDGIGPVGNMIMDATGALYGLTMGGGSGCAPSIYYPIGCGTVFKLIPPASGTVWTEKILYAFKGTPGSSVVDGAGPTGSIAMDAAGNIYGATQFGGTEATPCGTLPNNAGDGYCGTVFKLTYNGAAGSYSESLLHQFTDGADGSIPSGGIVMDGKGNLYGTTLQGSPAGTAYSLCANFGYSGCGQVFELTKASAYATKITLRAFTGGDGATPLGLSVTGHGRVIGVNTMNTTAETCSAAVYYCGTVWMLTPTAAAWYETVLYKFTGSSGALAGAQYGISLDSNGKIYGVALQNVTSSAFILAGATP